MTEIDSAEKLDMIRFIIENLTNSKYFPKDLRGFLEEMEGYRYNP